MAEIAVPFEQHVHLDKDPYFLKLKTSRQQFDII